MKTVGIVILFPLFSVLVVSLYVAGGTSRVAAFVLLVASVIGVLAGVIRKRGSNSVG